MDSILAFFGWKYIKDRINGKYHHYKCRELVGIYNRKTSNMDEMVDDLEKHPYSVKLCGCIEKNR